MAPRNLQSDPALRRLPFSRWTTWVQRHEIDLADAPGVYLLGRFDRPPPPEVNPLDQRVLYIGETAQQSLRRRWYQFERSAFQGKSGHSGGRTYRRHVAKSPRRLYVSALPVTIEDPAASAYIRAVERLLIWAHVARYDTFPRCNRK